MAEAIAIAGVVAAVASTGVAAYSSKQQADAAEDAADFNAAVARNDAIVAQQQSEFEAQQVDRRNRLLEGSQRARFAKSGVEIGGTPSDVLYDTAIQSELDKLASLYTGQVTANRFKSEAQLSSAKANSARRAGQLNMGSSILTGVSNTSQAVWTYQSTRKKPNG